MSLHGVPVAGAQAPDWHAVQPEHAAPLATNMPLALHVCGCEPLHPTAPCVHTPMQAPPEQVCPVQVLVSANIPFAPHVCATLPEQRSVPGTHEPTHAPLTHAEFMHGTG